VTINYRLHALGFLHLGDLFAEADGTGTGNLAILDQIAALRWVRRNIAAFGGDPANMTIFGQSAGAGCVGTLLGTPAADGLYRRAILMSGAASHALPAATATRIAERVLSLAGVRDWAGLWHVSSGRLVRAAMRVFALEAAGLLGDDFHIQLPFLPVIDGVVSHRPPIARVRSGERAAIELLIGTCADEYAAFTWGLPPFARHLLPAAPITADLLAAYAERRPGAGPRRLRSAIAGDQMFTIPAIRLAEAQAHSGGRAHMYRFTWPSPARRGALGACHGVDLPFAFDTLETARALVGRTPPRLLADELHAAFVRFAASGDPGADWPPYDLEQRSTMELGSRRRIVHDPGRSERLLWEGVW
jgi:para-nitrobenzyl esterase